MADLQYGQALMLACCGNQVSLSKPPNGGYLALDGSNMAVTTDTRLAVWELQSVEGKKGSVSVGDAVRIVNTGPNPPYKSASILKCGPGFNTQASGTDPSSKEDDTIWYVAMCSAQDSTVPENSYIALCNKVGWVGVGAVTGNFLNVWYPNGMVSGAPPVGGANVIMNVYTRYPMDTGQGGNTWWQVLDPNAPQVTTGKKCCFDLPDHALFTVAFVNQEASSGTITVSITGQMPVTIPVPAGNSTGSRQLIAGAGTPDQGGKNLVCIQIADSQSNPMLLGWQPPVIKDGKNSIHIGAEKIDPSTGNYPPDGTFNDMVVTVSW